MTSNVSVLLLVGSGVSKPSRLLDVRQITRSIFDKWWSCDGAGEKFWVEKDPGIHPSTRTEDGATQAFLRLVKSYADRFHAVRSGGESNYEDIYFLCSQFIDDALENPAADGFMREVTEASRPLYEGPSASGLRSSYELAKRACRLIQSAVFEALRTPEEIVGLELLGSLARSEWVAGLNLVTLNHDMLLERYLEGLGWSPQSGFGPCGDDLRCFDRRLFDGNDRIRLLKLHGSIDWHLFLRDREAVVGRVEELRPNDRTLRDGTIAKWQEGPLILTGTSNKDQSYGDRIFAEQFFRFHQVLYAHDRLIVSGYGFRDHGVNRRIGHWLQGDRRRRLIVLHCDPEELRRSSSAKYLGVQQWASEGRIHFVPQFLQDVRDAEIVAEWLK